MPHASTASEHGTKPAVSAGAAPKGSARERILDAASRLFYARGIAATGIDAIVAEAGVAKMSLYNTFGSKAGLVTAYIESRHRDWLAHHARRLAEARPGARALAVFDAYLDHAADAYAHGFRGCGQLNAAAELPADDPGRGAVLRHKEEVERLLRDELGVVMPAARAEDLAEHLATLLEGAVTLAGLRGGPERIERARALAERLIEAETAGAE